MSFSWISPEYPFTVRLVKGTSGGANGKQEYVCEAEPGSATSAAVWRIRKMVYDSSGFQTQVLWADGDRNFNNIQDNYASLSYS